MKQSDWVKGFKFGFTLNQRINRLIDFAAGMAVGAIITILARLAA